MKRDFNFDIVARGGGEFPLMRAGVIHTPHGDVKTPTFNVVGTHGEVKFISPTELHQIGAQVMLSNGYHLLRRSTLISASGGLANYSGWNSVTFTDSGGFQVMSLGSGLGKVISMNERDALDKSHMTGKEDRLAVVDDEGVEFRDPYSSRIIKFTPELSIQTQHKIGADVMMSFDELTNISDTYEYNVESLERTRKWAERGLAEHIRQTAIRSGKPYQALYGCLQGGYWEDLRRKAARDLAAMNIDGEGFDGFGLGGALEKEMLGDILSWMTEILPETKPRHLLGLSQPDDIFVGVENGADTFDCVAPTREGRHGRVYSLDGNFSIKKACYSNDDRPLTTECDCPTCSAGIRRSEIRRLIKSQIPEERARAFTMLSMHNVRFILHLTERIRQAIIDGVYREFRDQWCARYYKS